MKRIHIVNPYQSPAMTRMALPFSFYFPSLYVVSEGGLPNEDADLNFHIPYHSFARYRGDGLNAIAYTHCNPPDAGNLLDACNRADLITCMSFAGRRELVDLGADPRKLHVIYSATDQFQFRRRNILVAGFVQPNGRKREGLLLDLAWNYDLSPFHFVIVGGGWEPVVNALRIAGVSVEWVDAVDDEGMKEIYRHTDLLLVTGYVEGGPLPLLEALASGLRVISPPFGYAADILDARYHYSTFAELTQRLDEYIGESVQYHQFLRGWTWRDYAAEHALIFGRLLGESTELVAGSGMDRYAQILDVIDECRPASIIEIGTWNGKRAVQMIQQAAHYRPIGDIYYMGFDLFGKQTGGDVRREFSKFAWPRGVVKRRIEATGAMVDLIEGNTYETLETMLIDADLFFIDGGHSIDTITNDWFYVSRRMHESSIAIFDDYYHPAREGIGCNVIIDNLDRDKWDVEQLPARTRIEGGEIAMVKVSRVNADLRLSVSTETHAGSEIDYLGAWGGVTVQGMQPDYAPRTAGGDGELGGASPAPGTPTPPGSESDD